MDDRVRNLDILANGVGIDDPQDVLVLEEPAAAASQVSWMAAADHFERRHRRDFDAKVRLVGDDLHAVGFEGRAREPEIEVLADPYGTRARAPPASNLFYFDVADT